jgi:TetR/AcrR family fatty acid metabolism transcriptional regulator
MGTFVEKIQQKIAGKESAVEKLLMMVKLHFQLLSEDHHLAIVTQLELRQSNKDLRLKINDVLKNYLHVVDQILLEGKEKGEFSPKLDIRLARQMIFGTMDETITSWVMNEQRYDLTALAPSVHQLLISGCGHKS